MSSNESITTADFEDLDINPAFTPNRGKPQRTPRGISQYRAGDFIPSEEAEGNINRITQVAGKNLRVKSDPETEPRSPIVKRVVTNTHDTATRVVPFIQTETQSVELVGPFPEDNPDIDKRFLPNKDTLSSLKRVSMENILKAPKQFQITKRHDLALIKTLSELITSENANPKEINEAMLELSIRDLAENRQELVSERIANEIIERIEALARTGQETKFIHNEFILAEEIESEDWEDSEESFGGHVTIPEQNIMRAERIDPDTIRNAWQKRVFRLAEQKIRDHYAEKARNTKPTTQSTKFTDRHRGPTTIRPEHLAFDYDTAEERKRVRMKITHNPYH